MLNTVVHVEPAGLPGPAGRADTRVAADIIQHAASSVVTWLLVEESHYTDIKEHTAVGGRVGGGIASFEVIMALIGLS